MEFKCDTGLNKKGQKLLDAYEAYLGGNLPEIIQEATKKALCSEKDKVKDAVLAEVSLSDFKTVLESYKCYVLGDHEWCAEAVKFVENRGKTNYSVERRGDKVQLRKYVGIKASEVATLFGVDKSKATILFNNGFVENFVGVYMRQHVLAALNNCPFLNGIKWEVKDAYRVSKRNIYDISIEFLIAPSEMSSDVCDKIEAAIEDIEKLVDNMFIHE